MTGRVFFSDKERFAELLNLHLYHGAKVLSSENLVQRKREYSSLADVYGQKNRDILMEDTKNRICYGVELETEADFLSTEDHRTDLKEFFQAMQCRQDRERLRKLLRSDGFQRLGPETELAIAAHLNIRRLVRRMRKGEVPMCKAFDDLMQEERRNGRKEGMEKGIEKGLEKGIKKGKKEGKKEGKKAERLGIIGRMKKEGLEEAQIIRLTRCTKEEYAAAPVI